MAICKDCIAANDLRAPQASPCEGITISVIFSSGRTDSSPLVVKDNPQSLIGYDYVFTVGGQDYTIVYNSGQWVVINAQGVKVYYSTSTGSNNNLCPPRDGWTDVNGEFTSFFVEELIPPGPSLDCINPNATFDSNSTGWIVSNGAWSAEFGGTVKYDTVLLGSIRQDNLLSVGETYSINVSYYAPAARESCTPAQYSAGFIQIYAGTNFYREELRNTVNEPGQVRIISIALTCEGNGTLKVEVQDPNQCFATVSGARGVFLDDICAILKTNDVDPVGPSPLPSVEYRDTTEVPARVNGVDYNTKLLQFQDCLATKGTTFYNKIIGAVKCDYRELTKLKLIIELLGQKNIDRALDCIYDRSEFPTTLYPEIPCNITIPFIEGGSNTVTLPGDYSQFETFTFDVSIPSGYAIASGPLIFFTGPAYFYTNPGELTFDPTGYYYALHNSLTYQLIDDFVPPIDVFNPAPILSFSPGMPVPPASTGDIVFSGTVISEFGILTPANNTIYTIYDPAAVAAGGETFTSTIIDAVYDPVTDTTTIILADPFPGDAVGATLCLTQDKENTNNYLETFINFANRFCADCMITGPAPTPSTPATPSLEILRTPLTGETGIEITTEFNQQITI